MLLTKHNQLYEVVLKKQHVWLTRHLECDEMCNYCIA